MVLNEKLGGLQVAQLTVMTEYMVVLEGNSRPQNQAIAQNIEEKMEETHDRKTKSQVRVPGGGGRGSGNVARPMPCLAIFRRGT